MPLSLRVKCIKTGLNAAGIKIMIQYIIIFNYNYIILDMSLSLSSLRVTCIKTGVNAAGIKTKIQYINIFNYDYIILDMSLSLSSLRETCIKTAWSKCCRHREN